MIFRVNHLHAPSLLESEVIRERKTSTGLTPKLTLDFLDGHKFDNLWLRIVAIAELSII